MQASLTYVLPDKMGGVLNMVANLLAYRRPDAFRHGAVLTHNFLGSDTRFGGRLAADFQLTVRYALPLENLHAVLRRLARAIPPAPGLVVANDLLELALFSARDTGHTVFHMLHGDDEYYYRLAEVHEPVIDAYVAYSRAMYDELARRLPRRRETMFHLPYGIPLPPRIRSRFSGPLRLVYAGRLEQGQKRIFDLPEIDRQLCEAGVEVLWTVVGGGPDEAELRRRWRETARVRWLGVKSNREVVSLLAEHDVFVLPSKVEGFPVALLEAMGAGLVPVASDLRSGVREVVEQGKTGFRVPLGDVEGFARAILTLDRDRERLEEMSRKARAVVEERHDIRKRAPEFQDLCGRWRDLRRPREKARSCPYGSRLDRPWLPNLFVFACRWLYRTARAEAVR